MLGAIWFCAQQAGERGRGERGSMLNFALQHANTTEQET